MITPRKEQPSVLLVDDQPENLDVIRHALAAHFRILVATNGALALRVVQQVLPDIILLDIVMPVMDGYEACQRLKGDPRTAAIPIIFLTSRDEAADEAKGLAMGAADYIRKPANPPVVLSRVRNLVDLFAYKRDLEKKNQELAEALKVHEDVERITRHDLKGPLSGVIGLPELMLLDDNLTEGQRAILKMMMTSGYTMLEMINRSMDMIKMETGRYTLQPERFDLKALLARVLGELAVRLSVKRLRAVVDDGQNGSFWVWGERMLSYPLWQNLLLNAIEASREGAEIRVDLAHRPEGDTIRITNTGTVPETIRERFFGKYVTAGKKNGTGLGTYSAWLVVKSHGGTIALDTSVDHQTTITVVLPAPPT